MIYVLILIYLGGGGVTTQEFTDESSCKAALTAVTGKYDSLVSGVHKGKLTGICVRKGSSSD